MTMIYLTQERLSLLLLSCGVEKAKADEIVPAATRETAKAEMLDHKNAERYRKVRRGQHWNVVDGGGCALRGDALDAEVDAVLAVE